MTDVGIGVEQHIEVGVHDHRRPVLILVTRQSRRAQRQQRVGPACAHMGGGLFPRRHRDLLAESLQGSSHDRPLSGGQLGVEQEPATVVGVLPLQPTGAFVVLDLIDPITRPKVAGSADGAGRDRLRPPNEGVLVVDLGEPRELDDLVDAEVATSKRVGRSGQPGEGAARMQPALGLPTRDVEVHRCPLRHVDRAVVDPGFACLELRERLQQFALPGGDLTIERMDAFNQSLRALRLQLHDRPVPGEDGVEDQRRILEHMFDVKSCFAVEAHRRPSGEWPRGSGDAGFLELP